MADIYEHEQQDGKVVYVIATWNERAAQFQTTYVHPHVRGGVQGYTYTFARTIAQLVTLGARVFASAESAKRWRDRE